jgi:hypothetical protein
MGEVSAMKRHDIREMLALDQAIADADVQAHVDTCGGCAPYYRQHLTIDVVLRAELRWEAPETLTARLLARASRRTTCGALGAIFLGRTIQTRSRLVALLRNNLFFRPASFLPAYNQAVYEFANRKRPLHRGDYDGKRVTNDWNQQSG